MSFPAEPSCLTHRQLFFFFTSYGTFRVTILPAWGQFPKRGSESPSTTVNLGDHTEMKSRYWNLEQRNRGWAILQGSWTRPDWANMTENMTVSRVERIYWRFYSCWEGRRETMLWEVKMLASFRFH